MIWLFAGSRASVRMLRLQLCVKAVGELCGSWNQLNSPWSANCVSVHTGYWGIMVSFGVLLMSSEHIEQLFLQITDAMFSTYVCPLCLWSVCTTWPSRDEQAEVDVRGSYPHHRWLHHFQFFTQHFKLLYGMFYRLVLGEVDLSAPSYKILEWGHTVV